MKIVANGCSSVLSFSVTITDVETHIKFEEGGSKLEGFETF